MLFGLGEIRLDFKVKSSIGEQQLTWLFPKYHCQVISLLKQLHQTFMSSQS